MPLLGRALAAGEISRDHVEVVVRAVRKLSREKLAEPRPRSLVCSPCHTQIHQEGSWQLVMMNGVPWARPPAYVDPHQRLIRNTFHDSLDQAARFGTQLRFPLPPGAPESEVDAGLDDGG